MTTFMKGEYMNFSKKTFAVTALAAAISLAGCSSDNPDSGSSVKTTSIPGIAVDGYLTGATVYVDLNNDGRKNAGEPSAITDKDGYFSTGKDLTDYCANDASSLESLYCLKTAGVESNLVIRTFGGFDIFTGEPFEGSLAARINVDENGVVDNQMVSPLTSVLVDVDEDDKQGVLDAFGLGTSDLEADFLDTAGFNANTVNSAIKLHKVVTLLSEVLVAQYEEFGEERGFPETPNAILYKALAASIDAQGALNGTAISNAFAAALVDIEALYDEDDDLDYPGDANGAAAISDAQAIIAVVDNAIPNDTAFADAKTRVIGVETVVKKMIDEDADVDDAITEASNTGSGLYTAIDNALGADGGDVDFITLTDAVDYSAPDYGDVAIVGGGSFASLADRQLFVEFEDDEESGSGYFFFNSDNGESGGELKACIRYDDGDEATTEFEETEGVLLSGNWFSLDDSRLILNLAGSLNLSLFDRGTNDDDEQRFTLSYGGETRSWISGDGITDELDSLSTSVEQPTDDDSCAALLAENDEPS